MEQLGQDGQPAWSRMMLYLVSTDGLRLTQTASHLAELSQQSRKTVEGVLGRLVESGVLRSAYRSHSSAEPLYEVSDDAMTGALLEWHSQFVQARARLAGGQAALRQDGGEEAGGRAPSLPGRDFPYQLLRERLRRGRVIPFLGAGASLSGSVPVASGREVKEVLARACDFPASEFEQSDVAEVASLFTQRLGREELDRLLEETLGTPGPTPSETHRFLAGVAKSAPLLILTTNYDTLMEQALDEERTPYDTVAYLRAEGDERGGLAVIPHGATAPKSIRPGTRRTVVYRLNGPLSYEGREPVRTPSRRKTTSTGYSIST